MRICDLVEVVMCVQVRPATAAPLASGGGQESSREVPRHGGSRGVMAPSLRVPGLVPVRVQHAMTAFREVLHGEFDPGSGRTLAACLTHASGATNQGLPWGRAAN